MFYCPINCYRKDCVEGIGFTLPFLSFCYKEFGVHGARLPILFIVQFPFLKNLWRKRFRGGQKTIQGKRKILTHVADIQLFVTPIWLFLGSAQPWADFVCLLFSKFGGLNGGLAIEAYNKSIFLVMRNNVIIMCLRKYKAEKSKFLIPISSLEVINNNKLSGNV